MPSRRDLWRRLTAFGVTCALLLGVFAQGARAQESGPGQTITRIRDAEIESYIKEWTAPVFRAAGFDPSQINIVIIGDTQINSFVAGGLNVFIYAGLLIQSDNANQVIGVEAHETGHLAGGHLVRFGEAMEHAEIVEILGFLAGAVAAAASGQGAAGPAMVGGGTSLAERSFLSFSRTQERSADQAATTFLDATGQSPRGLLQFMQKLEGEEFRAAYKQDPYLRTHPLTEDRITFLENVVAHSKYADTTEPAAYLEQHHRMRGKLIGFLWPIPRVFQHYKESDNSVEARYARSVAYHREAREDEAEKLLGSLLAEKPDDPFFNELMGQFKFEAGKVRDSIPYYQKADRLFPHNPLIETELAQSMVETGDARYDQAALAALNEAVINDRDDPTSWRLLATIYGRQGNQAEAALALAEEAYADGRFKDAKGQAKRAERLFPAGSPGNIRAQDIEQQSTRILKDKS